MRAAMHISLAPIERKALPKKVARIPQAFSDMQDLRSHREADPFPAIDRRRGPCLPAAQLTVRNYPGSCSRRSFPILSAGSLVIGTLETVDFSAGRVRCL